MIYDISMTVEPNMTVYKNRDQKKPRFAQSASFEEQGVYETDLTLNLHTGTHIDFPLHTLKDGKNSNKHPLEPFLGEAKVLDFTHINGAIGYKDLLTCDIKENDFILFKTKNSFQKAFDFEFVYLDTEGATYLAQLKIRGVGIDALGIERNQPNHPTHDILLKNDIIILEGIVLHEVPAGVYQFICLPLKIADVEALPVRALLIK